MLSTEASKTGMKTRWGGSRGFTTYYAAPASNRRQDLCAEAQQAWGPKRKCRGPQGLGITQEVDIPLSVMEEPSA